MDSISLCDMDFKTLNRTFGSIVLILDDKAVRQNLTVLLTIVFFVGVWANYGMIRKLLIWRKRLGHLDRASLYLIYAGSLSGLVVLVQLHALLTWPNRSTNLSLYLDASDIWPMAMEFCTRVSLISKSIFTCQIAVIRWSYLCTHLELRRTLLEPLSCVWKFALIASTAMALITIYSSTNFNQYRGIPIYHALAQRQILGDRPKCTVFTDRLVVYFLSVMHLLTLFSYVCLFKSLFDHDYSVRVNPMSQNRQARFKERHRKNVSHAWAHFLCWVAELVWPIFLFFSLAGFDIRRASDSVVLCMFLVPSINFAWGPFILNWLS
ncbi:uncharacterized protein LOC131880353 [Tigriopus californicus]|uniref:uncharacterized protein LOC131880353 n=1 Tax=Tigriopus californicus TaxID=6832 RepID=UPI0027DA753F|nr:uncharacterized protein LOC131880353 [Tigriopus californicus]